MRQRNRGAGRNYLPVLLILIFWWCVVGTMVWWVDPMMVADIPVRGSFLIPALLVWIAVWYTLSLVVGNKKRGGVVASGVMLYLYFRLWGVDTWWNVALLAVIFGLIYRFVAVKSQKPELTDPSV